MVFLGLVSGRRGLAAEKLAPAILLLCVSRDMAQRELQGRKRMSFFGSFRQAGTDRDARNLDLLLVANIAESTPIESNETPAVRTVSQRTDGS
jgi:hypothetical protein